MWLANKETAMLCIIIVIMWQYVGYHMVIQLAAMRNIDSLSMRLLRLMVLQAGSSLNTSHSHLSNQF